MTTGVTFRPHANPNPKCNINSNPNFNINPNPILQMENCLEHIHSLFVRSAIDATHQT